MKKIITFAITYIIASILFPSCKSNTSITKRLYTKGYYIAHSSRKQTSNSPNAKQTMVLNTARPSLYSLPNASEGNNRMNGIKQNNMAENTISAANQKTEKKTNVIQPTKHVAKHRPLITPQKKVSQIIPAPFALKKIKKDSTAEDDARSLLWIIILVILVLWAVGFAIDAFALGGLIHLLLVIALILFILWLFRIL